MEEKLLDQMIKEMESLKCYTTDSKSGKRKEAKKNVAIDECIKIVRRCVDGQRFGCADY